MKEPNDKEETRKKERNVLWETVAATKVTAAHEVPVLSKNWPDGSRYRRRMPNITVLRKVRARIEESIAMGTWQKLKKELTEPEKKAPVVEEFDPTIAEFAKIYYDEYCVVQNTRPEYKEKVLAVITRLAGEKKLREFSTDDAQKLKAERKKEGVKDSTVNHAWAVLSNMFTFAKTVKKLISVHPMHDLGKGMGKLKVDESVRRIMTMAEKCAMVDHAMDIDEVVGAFLGFLGETALRKGEGFGVKRELLDLKCDPPYLTLEASKNHKTRQVPLSKYAIELIRGLTPVVGNPHLFVRLDTMDRLYESYVEDVVIEAAQRSGVLWPRCHDFRHFRATQWLKGGVDIKTVMEWMGHEDIETTMIYQHFVKGHAETMFRAAEAKELKERQNGEKLPGNISETQSG